MILGFLNWPNAKNATLNWQLCLTKSSLEARSPLPNKTPRAKQCGADKKGCSHAPNEALYTNKPIVQAPIAHLKTKIQKIKQTSFIVMLCVNYKDPMCLATLFDVAKWEVVVFECCAYLTIWQLH